MGTYQVPIFHSSLKLAVHLRRDIIMICNANELTQAEKATFEKILGRSIHTLEEPKIISSKSSRSRGNASSVSKKSTTQPYPSANKRTKTSTRKRCAAIYTIPSVPRKCTSFAFASCVIRRQASLARMTCRGSTAMFSWAVIAGSGGTGLPRLPCHVAKHCYSDGAAAAVTSFSLARPDRCTMQFLTMQKYS